MPDDVPTSADVQRLVEFLPILHDPKLELVKWHLGNQSGEAPTTLPHPNYHPVIEEFVQLVTQPCWLDRRYDPVRSGKLLRERDHVAEASLKELRPLFTFIIGGERFC